MLRTGSAVSPKAHHGTQLDLGNAIIWSEFSTLTPGLGSTMGPAALALAALAVGAVFFALRGRHTDPENTLGQDVG